MTGLRALGIVLLSGIAFSATGGLVGATLGAVAPSYYRSVVRNGSSPEFNPLQVGIGLGVTQGLVAGIGIGLGLLGILAWRESRADVLSSQKPTVGPQHPTSSWVRLGLYGSVTTILVVLTGAVAFVAGGVVGQQQLYQRWTSQKLDELEFILDSEELADVHPLCSSAAQVTLLGTVANEATRSALYEQLISVFGTEEADELIRSVDVKR